MAGRDELSRVSFSYVKTNGGKDQHDMLVSYMLAEELQG